jgi:phosphoglycerate dehydrogenase-like enzyme
MPKEELVRRSKIIMMQVPMTPQTYHFLSAREFAAMQSGVIIVNTRRGPTIDNAALYEALRSGSVAAAGLDDSEEEPAKRARWSPKDNPLFSLANVMVTPHAAYYSEESILLAGETAAKEVRRVFDGRATDESSEQCSTRRWPNVNRLGFNRRTGNRCSRFATNFSEPSICLGNSMRWRRAIRRRAFLPM